MSELAGARIGVVGEPQAHLEAHQAARTQHWTVVPEPTIPVDGHWAKGVQLNRPASGNPDEQVILNTSGTSGTPRLVPLLRSQFDAHRSASQKRLQTNDSTWAAVLPFHHVGGVALLDRVLADDLGLLLQGKLTKQAAQEWHGVTHVSLVPTQLHRLLEWNIPVPDQMRCVLIGGDRLSPELATRALAAGWPVHASYGLTEACSQVATATPNELQQDPSTVGKPLDGVQVRISAGEIVVSGPTTQGDVHTGDLGVLRYGRLHVIGRMDDRIISGGENIDPAVVEDALAKVGPVAIVGIPDAEWGQRVVCVSEGLPEAKLEAAAANLPRFMRPKAYVCVERLPRTPNGKLQRKAVREMLV